MKRFLPIVLRKLPFRSEAVRIFLGGFILSYCFVLLSSVYSVGNYLLEVLGMLLPYWLVFNLLVISTLVAFYIRFKSRQLSALIFVLTSVTLFLSLQFISFSFIKEPKGGGTSPVTVAFFNKLFSNTNFQEIDSRLGFLNPDIVGFSELMIADAAEIEQLKNYPCSYSKSARDGATIAVYSKYECKLDDGLSLPFVLPVTVKMNNLNYHVFVIHPMPPRDNYWMAERNKELNLLAEYINTLPKDKVLILGDFNLAPWSKTFRDLEKELAFLKNTAKGEGINFTWQGGFIRTQIDHIFVPVNSLVETFQSERINGSDHNLIWARIKV